MRTFWRGPQSPLSSHAQWVAKLDKKNRKQGTSAPSLASAWAGPLELFGALQRNSTLADAALDEIVVEAQSAFDEYPGGKRNHDLVVHAHLPNEERIVVCVEAKAGEDLGPTVAEFRKAAEAKRNAQQTTNAPERLRDLLALYVADDTPCESAEALRYQLLTALAGTEAEAARTGAQHAVLMVHEFVADQRPGDQADKLTSDLSLFCTTVLGFEPPSSEEAPWCVEVQKPATAEGKLYFARASTDLRTVVLAASPSHTG